MPHDAQVLRRLRRIGLDLPEARERVQFGHPVWQAGWRTFCALERCGERLRIAFKLDLDTQALLVRHPRFEPAPYGARHGWVLLDAESALDWSEVEHWIATSDRDVALVRMRRALDDREAARPSRRRAR